MKRSSALANLLLGVVLVLTISPTAAAQVVNIEIKGGSISSMTPSELFVDTDYEIKVKVLDETGNPVQGAKVGFSIAGGAVSIVGDSLATTGSDGVAILRIKFDEGGVVKLLLDESTVDRVFIYYQSLPSLGGSLIGVVLILLSGSLLYLIYAGPVKWYLEERVGK